MLVAHAPECAQIAVLQHQLQLVAVRPQLHAPARQRHAAASGQPAGGSGRHVAQPRGGAADALQRVAVGAVGAVGRNSRVGMSTAQYDSAKVV